MSALENQLKPTLTTLILGERILLDAEHQLLLATWIAKTVMTAEFSKPDLIGIPQQQRTWLSEHGTPPAGWNIWIAAYAGLKWRLDIVHHVADLLATPSATPSKLSGRDHPRNTQATTFGLGRLAVHAFSSTRDHLQEVSLPQERTGTIVRIWPATHPQIDWPPTHYLFDKDMDELANALANSLRIAPLISGVY